MGVIAARACDDKKAEDVLLLDLRSTAYGLADFLLILSANSQVHLRALRETVEDLLEEMSLSPVHKDGLKSDKWSILDYGGLLVHIFYHEARQFYSLERLWETPKKVLWKPAARPVRVPAKKPKNKKKIVR